MNSLSNITDARHGEYFLVNVLGRVTRRSMTFAGSYGAKVYQFQNGEFVRRFGM